MKKIIIAALGVIALSSCNSQQSLYSWYDSEHATYVYTKRNTEETLEKAMAQYKKVIANQNGLRKTVPPGVNAEYGYLLYKAGKKKEDFEKYMSNIDTLLIGSHDVGIALQNATVAAESMGLGTCHIGAIRNKPLEIVKLLNLPKYVIPLIGLTVGYPDDDPGLKPRLPPKAVCFGEKYNTENAKAGIDEYDETFKKYLAERESNARDSNWSQRISNTYTSFEFKDDYELLKQQGYNCLDKK